MTREADDDDDGATWRTREGKLVKIRDMDNGHLLNLNRALRAGTVTAEAFTHKRIAAEIRKRGLTPLQSFTCPEEAQAMACISTLYRDLKQQMPDVDGLLAACAEAEAEADAALRDETLLALQRRVAGNVDLLRGEDALAPLKALTQVREFFRLRQLVEDPAQLNAALHRWMAWASTYRRQLIADILALTTDTNTDTNTDTDTNGETP